MIPTILLLATLAQAPAAEARGMLVVVGGGPADEVVQRRVLELAGGPDARVLVVPYASNAPDAGERTAGFWRSYGAERVDVLDVTRPDEAVRLIDSADLIWMRGGSQVRLMQALVSAPGVPEAIRRRYERGAIVGGTSAGAAVMSQLMIAGYERRGDRAPRCADGLGLWPDVIVDQHFLRRNRLERLRAAVEQNPRLLGVGIDESTAVIVRGREFEVLGRSDVVVVDARGVEAAGIAVADAAIAAAGEPDARLAVPPPDREADAADRPDRIVTSRLKPGMRYHLDRGILGEPDAP